MRLAKSGLIALPILLWVAGCKGTPEAPQPKPPAAESVAKNEPSPEAVKPTTTAPSLTEAPKTPTESPAKTPYLPSDKAMAAQKEKLALEGVPKIPQEGWGTTDKNGQEVAREADKALGNLRSTAIQTYVRLKNPRGFGESRPRAAIQDLDHFLIEYVKIENDEPHTFQARADGQHKAVMLPGSFIRKGSWESLPMKGAPIPSTRILKDWPTEFPRLALSPIIDKQPAFEAYVAALAGSGAKVSAEKRVTPFKGQLIVAYRIRAVSKDGKQNIEMVFDGQSHLPVTIRTSESGPKGPVREMLWSTAYTPNAQFDARIFQLPGTL